MTGKELAEYIEQTEMKIEEVLTNFPDLEGSLEDKKARIRMVRAFTHDHITNHPNAKIPSDLEVYAVSVLKKVLSVDHETRHIDYSPMYQHIAQYNLTISRVCEILGISNNTRNLISNNKLVHMSVLKKISDFLECDINDLFVFISEEERIRRLEKFALYKSPKKGEYSINAANILQGMDEGYRVNIVKQATRDKNRLAERILRSGSASNEFDEEILADLRNLIAHGGDPMDFILLNTLMNNDSQQTSEESSEDAGENE